jgi:CO/xanthine dehydrogenase FAD-binding subunit
MNAFRYLEPGSVGECLELLAHHGPGAQVLAGGTDLVVKLRERSVRPDVVIGLAGVSALRYLERDDDGSVAIGAMTTLDDVARAHCLADGLGLVRQGAEQVSCMQIRNVATIGGNSCSASPSADTVPPLIAAGAEVRLVGSAGERCLPLEEFFQGPGRTVMESGELLHGFRLPPPPPRTAGAYMKYAIRGAFDLAIVGIATRVTFGEGDRIRAAAIVMGAVGPTPMRARRAESLLTGETPTDERIREAARIAAAESAPISDQRASADYRRRMVEVSTRSALHAAVRDARAAGVTRRN